MRKSSFGAFAALSTVLTLALSPACGPQEMTNEPDPEPEMAMEPEVEPEPECNYPSDWRAFPNAIGQAVPSVSYTNVQLAPGETGDFSFEAFFCDEAYSRYETMTVVQVATWCPNCPQYVNNVNSMANSLDNSNSLIVWMVMQNNQRQRADGATSADYMNYYLNDNAPGIIVGDGESDHEGWLDFAWTFVPNGFVIRKSDMKIIARQETTGNFLPYGDIAADPTSDWSSGLAPFASNCSDGDEESSEPNNGTSSAAPITAGSYTGGICDQNSDVYQVQVDGNWTVDLLFTHSVGDLDLYVLDSQGQAIDRSESINDNEQISGTGPAFVAVVGYTGASAPYTLNLTAQ